MKTNEELNQLRDQLSLEYGTREDSSWVVYGERTAFAKGWDARDKIAKEEHAKFLKFREIRINKILSLSDEIIKLQKETNEFRAVLERISEHVGNKRFHPNGSKYDLADTYMIIANEILEKYKEKK